MTIVAGRLALVAASGAALAVTFAASGCSDPCCVIDSFPITLLSSSSSSSLAGTSGAGLSARARDGDGDFTLSVDTGSALTFFARKADERAQMVLRSFEILDALAAPQGGAYPVRARLNRIEGLPVALDPVAPRLILGAAYLANYSVEFEFAGPRMTLWPRLGASDLQLTTAGFAVLHFTVLGGVELSAVTRPDIFGLTGPVQVPPTRVVLRACVGARAFNPDEPLPEVCCKRGDEVSNATGADMALLVATGVGPMVMAESAWARYTAAQAVIPGAPVEAPIPGPDLPIPGVAAPLTNVLWATIPRMALVNSETSAASNPGACVELGRARRLQWVEAHREQGACAQPCDSDSRLRGVAQNAAAYVETDRSASGNIPVAIIADATPFLQALRVEVRPEGPEIDGLAGADVFADTTLELDYPSRPGRAIFSCASETTPRCRTSPRCQRIENAGEEHACFGLTPRKMPAVCAASGCGQ